ncbi:MAG: type II toxin-antitoxin system RelE/ParE family toxin [Thiogranum sp.]|nr:type II toxin-antitoxin system RelE/ParE family toxin [Thiogranum sp.]
MSGNEPVREWLKGLSKLDKRAIGGDIKTVQYGWPLGMPVVRKMDHGLWEIRSRLDKRIARILFTVQDEQMIHAAWLHQEVTENATGRPATGQGPES